MIGEEGRLVRLYGRAPDAHVSEALRPLGDSTATASNYPRTEKAMSKPGRKTGHTAPAMQKKSGFQGVDVTCLTGVTGCVASKAAMPARAAQGRAPSATRMV